MQTSGREVGLDRCLVAGPRVSAVSGLALSGINVQLGSGEGAAGAGLPLRA